MHTSDPYVRLLKSIIEKSFNIFFALVMIGVVLGAICLAYRRFCESIGYEGTF